MNKQDILKRYGKESDKLLVAKILDKIYLANSKNKIINTDFLDMYQKNLVQVLLKNLKYDNYVFFGGDSNSERVVGIFYPDKFNKDIIKKNCNSIMGILEIILPNDLKGKFTHRDYLGGLIKLGIKREKIGDIIVFNEGANIVILNEIINFVKSNVSNLTRFNKSCVQIKKITELHKREIKTEKVKIIITSLRLDNIVSEIAKTSRAKAEEIITSGKVFCNFENIMKTSKILKENDIITIRGKGRFVLKKIEGSTKKGKIVVNIEKYI